MRARSLALALALGAMSCGRTRASVVVHVVTDMTWGPQGEVKAVRVRVYSGVGQGRTVRLDYRATLGQGTGEVQFPVRVGVLPLEGDTARVVTVEADACRDALCADDTVLVEQRAIFSFIEGEQRELPMLLAGRCRGVFCDDPTRTCGPLTGTCDPARVSADGLPTTARDAFAGQLGDGLTVDAVSDRVDDEPSTQGDVVTPDDVAPLDVVSRDVVDAAVNDVTADLATLDEPMRDVVTRDAPDAAAPPDATAPMDAPDVAPLDAVTLDTPDVVAVDVHDVVAVDTPDVVTVDVRDVVTVDTPDVVTVDTPDVVTPPVDVPRMCGTQVCRSIEGCCVALGGGCGCVTGLGCIARGLPLCL